MPSPSEKQVALLGGSFNPPHVAHLMAAYWALATQGVAEVWLLPAFQHPFGKSLAAFEDRVRMCELAAAGVRGVHGSSPAIRWWARPRGSSSTSC